MIYPENLINKVICGDCLEVMLGIPDNSVDLIVTDPPYLTTFEKWDKKEAFNEEVVKELFRVSKNSCSIYVWCGIGEKSQSLIRWFPLINRYFHFKDLITWKKSRGIGMRKGWLYTREEIMWFVKDNKKFIWNKEEQYSTIKRKSQKFGFKEHKKGYKIISENYRLSNVWIDIAETTWKWKNKILHFTPKPLKSIERIIKLHTKENDLVLDCFIGSGTTGVACKNLNRRFIGIEKEEKYCKIAEQRISANNQIKLLDNNK